MLHGAVHDSNAEGAMLAGYEAYGLMRGRKKRKKGSEAYGLMRGCVPLAVDRAARIDHTQHSVAIDPPPLPLRNARFRSSARVPHCCLRLALVRGRQQVDDQHHPVAAAERELVAGAVEVHAAAPWAADTSRSIRRNDMSA